MLVAFQAMKAAATMTAPANQSARQNWPRFADEDVLTACPSSRQPVTNAGRTRSIPHPTRERSVQALRGTLTDAQSADKGLCHVPATICCKHAALRETRHGAGFR